MPKKVVIVGGGFAGLNAAKKLGRVKDFEITVVDRRNHHLFQPLLYQVATAGLSPADIAQPIRGILSKYRNTHVLQGEVHSVDFQSNQVHTDFGSLDFDYLVIACGATHSYFGNDQWKNAAPGLKTIEDATEIRRRILSAFEQAERSTDLEQQKKWLTFVVVGGGPTGVELAGAIGEMSRYTLARDFRAINAKSTRVFLMEGSNRILSAFPEDLAGRAARDLENLGVQIWTSSFVTDISDDGIVVGNERIAAATVIWAAGVKASSLGTKMGLETDEQGRVRVNSDLSAGSHANVFVAGDQARVESDDGDPLPGLAPVAMQQGRHIAQCIRRDIAGKARRDFQYHDKGMMATIGRNKAIVKTKRMSLVGRFAWFMWLAIHIYFLTGFRNRLLVVMQWFWSYVTYRRGARLIVGHSREPDDNHLAQSDHES